MTHQTDVTLSEISESLTGFEELDIEKAFGRTYAQIAADDNFTMFGRALIAVHLSRTQSIPYTEAYDQAMRMPIRDLDDYFAPDEELDPDEPETPAGKEPSSPAPEPATELSGA